MMQKSAWESYHWSDWRQCKIIYYNMSLKHSKMSMDIQRKINQNMYDKMGIYTVSKSFSKSK